MKKMSILLTFTVCFVLMFNVSAMAKQGAITDFDVLPNGKVLVNGTMEFKNMGEYMRSDFFKKNGARCLIKKGHKSVANQALDAAVMAVASDCSTSQTVIQNEYWPQQAYTIPIVFHIIYKRDGTGNIPDSRIINQVQVLNEDYRAIAGSMGANSFDVKIQFELVGITRTQNDKWFRDGGQETRYKSALAWDTNTYMNVYVNSASGYLGYAYFPQDSAGEIYDGIVLLYSACGGRDEGSYPYDQGRTLVHEAGHYFGLYHTFQSGCGEGYTAGDLISDTPSESTAHFDCVQTHTCDTPDPIHNYMNYTDDLCLTEFTAEQGNRAVCSLVNYRPNLPYNGSDPDADMYVSDIAMSTQKKGKRYNAVAVVTIMDVDGFPVDGATVDVQWSGAVSGTSSGTTGADGTVSLASAKTRSTGVTFTATVTDVSANNRTYDSSLNVETSDSITN